MGKKADLINAMPVGSSWNATCDHGRGALDMGIRTVERHRSKDMQFKRQTSCGESKSFLDYPKKDDIVDIANGGKNITLKFKDEKGKVWSTVVYSKVEE